MNIGIMPAPLCGTIRAVASKSDAHRCLVAAALCEEPTQIGLNGTNADIDATCACLEALGAYIVKEAQGLYIRPGKGRKHHVLDCRESGATLRFLLPVAATGSDVAFTGSGRLPARPIAPLREALQKNGVQFSASALPFTLTGALRAGTYTLPGDISSQFISGLLFALPLLDGDSHIRLTTSLESRAYAEMTQETLRCFKIEVQAVENGFFVPGGQRYHSPGHIQTEGDWSGAAFFLCAGALGAEMCVEGLTLNSLQADKAILEILAAFGANVFAGPDRVRVAPAPLRGANIDVSQCPDLFPLCAVLAAAAHGESRLFNAGRLRLKESDRIGTVAQMLRTLGVDIIEEADALTIRGGIMQGGAVDSAGDHRIAMAAAIAALRAKGSVTVLGAECCAKSYPKFFADFHRLGGKVYVVSFR